MKITDEQIQEYCKRMDYKLIRIGKIAFSYTKPDGSFAALLKAAAGHKNRKGGIVEKAVPWEGTIPEFRR